MKLQQVKTEWGVSGEGGKESNGLAERDGALDSSEKMWVGNAHLRKRTP
jgi:hypothetical protein